jgi:branched-chain amino acid transport system substrate-binding protein
LTEDSAVKYARCLALPIVAIGLIAGSPVRAAEPYEINTILSLTGNIAFVGQTQLKSLKAIETMVNADGGIKGRPVSFVVSDDESSPQTAVQLAHNLIAKNVPIILGSSSPNACGAIAPLIAANGPLLYCLANGGDPVIGGYEFLTSMSYDSQMAVAVRYFRERGWHKIATIFATDSGGQTSEKALQGALALPENKSVQIVMAQHFAPGDASVAAQMAVIKGASPDVIVAWATGGAAGTLFRGEKDLGIELPTLSSPGNLTGAFLKQYAAVLPGNLIFAAVPYYGGDADDAATKKAVAEMASALSSTGAQPDMITISAWDPGLLLVTALRELGPNATATQLRDYFLKLKGWTGTNGPYDFTTDPQRGVGHRNVVMVRWDVPQAKAVALSELGGAPLSNK